MTCPRCQAHYPPGARFCEECSARLELGMRPLVAHCHLGLGKLYRCSGDNVKAHEHLITANAMYREMDVGFWLEKAEAACAEGES